MASGLITCCLGGNIYEHVDFRSVSRSALNPRDNGFSNELRQTWTSIDITPIWTAAWRGNVGVSPLLSKHSAINYISKYAAKAESKSTQMDQMRIDLAREAPNDGAVQTIITKAVNNFIIERDFLAQEVCHQFSMVECSCTFDSIDLRIP
jgi:hypothetical protein